MTTSILKLVNPTVEDFYVNASNHRGIEICASICINPQGEGAEITATFEIVCDRYGSADIKRDGFEIDSVSLTDSAGNVTLASLPQAEFKAFTEVLECEIEERLNDLNELAQEYIDDH